MSLHCVLNVVKRKFLIEACFCLALSVSFSAEVHAAYSEAEINALATPQEKKLNEIRDQEVAQIKTILKRSISKEQRADLLLRMGEVGIERFKFYFFKENMIWNQRIDAFLKQKDKNSRRPKLDSERSHSYLSQSIEYLERVLESIGQYDKLDEVYYYLGFNHWELGNHQKSISYFTKITNGYPQSHYLTEAYRYLGDYEFSNRRFKQSAVYYEKAANDKNSPTMPKILYGLAWAQYKTGQSKRALNTIVEAIRMTKGVNADEANKRGTALQNDAYDAMVLFYSESGNPKDAQEFFNKEVGEQAAPELLSKLMSIYQRQGRYGEALITSKQLESVDSSAKEAGSAQRYEILSNALKLSQQKRDPEREMGVLKVLIAEFVQKNASEEIQTSIRVNLRNSALAAHKESDKAANKGQAQARAVSLYKLYLGTFGAKTTKDDIYEIHYYLADLYSQSNRYREAAAEYRFIVKSAIDDSGNAYLQKIKRASAEGLIFTLDSYFEANKGRHADKAETDELLEAIDSFVQLYPADPDSAKFSARAAGMLKDNKDREAEYYERLRNIVAKYPGSPAGMEAAVLLVRKADEKGDFNQLQTLVDSLLANQRLMAQDKKGEFRGQLEGIQSKAKFKVVKDIEKGSNFAEAATRFEQLAHESKDREVRFKALNNAAVNYQRAGDRANELRVYRVIAKSYPDSTEAADRILSVADESFLTGQYADAADKYEEFYDLVESRKGKSGKMNELALNALRNAAFLRDALNQEDKSSENIRKIVAEANKGSAVARDAAEEFLFERATRLRVAADQTETVNAYKKYLNAFPNGKYSVESMVHLGNLYNDLREPEKAQGYLSKAAQAKGKGKNLSRSELGYAAEARLMLLDGLESAYKRSGLNLPEDELKRDVKLKLQRMEQLNKGYLQVIEYGDGKWALEAFYKMALTYQDFANQLEAAPVPAKYNEEDKAKFQAQLRAVAKPVRLKVNETLSTALKQGESLVVGDSSMAKIYVANALVTPEIGLPLIIEADWSDAKKWIMGGWGDDAPVRESLRSNPKNVKALLLVGNNHLIRGEERYARIYYAHALAVDPKYVPALNNLAYLEGKNGNMQGALAGFKQALSLREFEVTPKHNMAKIYMASGLWRHANLAYRQLEVRAGKDDEIIRGLGMSYLALGSIDKAKDYLRGHLGDDMNSKYAKAVVELGSGKQDDAKSDFRSLADKSEYARMVSEHWRR